MIEQACHRGFFHDLARVHHRHPVGHFGDHAQVVGDEDDRGTHLGAQVAHQVEDLRLDGDIQRGGGFVRDQQVGLAGQRHGDHHALGHAAGKFVRVGFGAAFRLGDAHQFEHLDGALFARFPAQFLMDVQYLGDLIPRPKDRVERGLRLLEDHGNTVAAHLHHLLLGGLDQVFALEEDLAFHDFARHADQAHDRKGGDAFPASRFADQSQHFTGIDIEVHAIHGLDNAVFGVKVGFEVFYFEQRGFGFFWHRLVSQTKGAGMVA